MTLLIGMFDSPFVRRVAISMKLLGFAFEHRNWSVGADFELIRRYNPLARVPTVVLDDGETLIDSAAILDFLDEGAGDRALLPRRGLSRRAALQIMAIASGAAEKGVAQIYETAFRPADKRHAPWVSRCQTQVHSALVELERECKVRGGRWFVDDRLTQADITVACVYSFLSESVAINANADAGRYPNLDALSMRCEVTPEFSSTAPETFSPPLAP